MGIGTSTRACAAMVGADGKLGITARCRIMIAVLEAGIACADGALPQFTGSGGVGNDTWITGVGVCATCLRVIEVHAGTATKLLGSTTSCCSAAAARGPAAAARGSTTASGLATAAARGSTAAARGSTAAARGSTTASGLATAAARGSTAAARSSTAAARSSTAAARGSTAAARGSAAAARGSTAAALATVRAPIGRAGLERKLVVIVRAAQKPHRQGHNQAYEFLVHQNVPCTVTEPGPNPTCVVGCSRPESLDRK